MDGNFDVIILVSMCAVSILAENWTNNTDGLVFNLSLCDRIT